MPIHTYNGHQIEVECYMSPKLLWMGIGFLIRINGAIQGRSPDRIEGLRTTVPFQFSDSGVMRHGRVVSGFPFTAAWAPYRIFVEEEQVASGITRASNWYVTYGILLAGALVLGLLLYFIHAHNHVAS
jgi:hypothetical protein